MTKNPDPTMLQMSVVRLEGDNKALLAMHDADTREIDLLRADAVAQRDGIAKLHKIIHDLKDKLHAAENEKARIDFAFRSAAVVIAHLEEQLGKTAEDHADRDEVEALGAQVIQ